MPFKSKRPCNKLGCSNVSATAYCQGHTVEVKKNNGNESTTKGNPQPKGDTIINGLKSVNSFYPIIRYASSVWAGTGRRPQM